MTSEQAPSNSTARSCLEALDRQGVSYVFGSPGSEDVHYWQAFGSDADVPEYVQCRHEQLAVDMARGYAQITGESQAVKLHGSLGTLNGALSIWGAYYSGTPLLVLSSYISDHTSGNGLYKLDFRHPTGQSDVAGSFTKWSISADNPGQIPEYAQRGIRVAEAPPEGPVFVNMPNSLLDAPLDDAEAGRGQKTAPAPSTPSNDVTAEIAERLQTAENPIAVVSDLGAGPEGPAALLDVAESLDLPVYEAPKVRHAFPMDHPLYQGNTAYGVRDQTPPYLAEEIDLVFVVGSSKPWYPPGKAAPDADIIFLGTNALNPRRAHWNYPADIVAEGDPATTLSELAAVFDASESGASPASGTDWRAKHETWDELWTARIEDAPADEVDPFRFTSHLDDYLPDDAIVVNETVDHGSCVTNVLRDGDDRRFVSAERMTAGGLGTGLGLALGAKLALPDRMAVTLLGDGAFHYNPVQAAYGAVQEHDLPLLTVLYDNSGYEAMRAAYEATYPYDSKTPEKYGGPIDPTPEYTEQVDAWGMHAERVTHPSEAEDAIRTCVETVRDGTSALLHVELPQTIDSHPYESS